MQITPRIDFKGELSGLFSLDKKVVFVPGGYGGIGEAICWGLALHGATVAVAGRSREKAVALAELLKNAGANAIGLEVDAEKIDSIRSCVEEVQTQCGGLNVLINCIGIQREEPLLEVTEENFDMVYRVNLKAAMFLAQTCARKQLQKQQGGRQIHLLSVRSQLGLRHRGYSAYCSTKGGLVTMIRQHAMELAPHGITVNGIAPTFVYTEMIRHVMENDAFRKQLLERIPLGRIADPKDLVAPVLMFAGPGGAFVTGQVLYVDGGITASQ